MSYRGTARGRGGVRTLATLASVLLLALSSVSAVLAVHDDPGQHHEFANDDFERTWSRTDKPVADHAVSRTWMWGEEPYSPQMWEEYEESPNHLREVQYFDKSRMEINNPGA